MACSTRITSLENAHFIFIIMVSVNYNARSNLLINDENYGIVDLNCIFHLIIRCEKREQIEYFHTFYYAKVVMKSINQSSSFVTIFIFPFFRFSKRYELPLLVQSVVMNITMFMMIHLCVKVRRNNNIMRARDRVFSGM